MTFKHAAWERFRETLRELHEPESAHSATLVLWRTLVAAFFAVAILSIAYGAVEFTDVRATVQTSGTTGTTTAVSPPILDQTKLDAVVSGFSARAARYDQLKAQPPDIPNPK